MATEDPDKIDELLRRYAKERREQGGDFALHEATRRMLQGEVGRQYGASQAQDGAKHSLGAWLNAWRGWLALGGSVAAVVLGVWMFGPGSQPTTTMQLAKNDSLADESRLMVRENLRAESDIKELAKEKAVAVVTASGSLTPVQNVPTDALIKDLGDVTSLVSKQKTESLYALTPAAGGTTPALQLNAPAPVALADSMKRLDEISAGASPAGGRARFTTTSGEAANAKPASGKVAAFATQPPATLAFEGSGGLGAAGQPVTLGRGANAPGASAAAGPPAADAYGVERKLSEALAESRSLSLVAADGARAAGIKGEAMVFFRQDAPVPQERFAESLARTEPQAEATRLQSRVAADKAASAPEVLSQFTVEVNGDTIRLTDVDQSIYEGVISNEATVVEYDSGKLGALDRPVQIGRRAVAKAATPASGTEREYYFRAAGSNASLKQLVILNGRLGGVAEPKRVELVSKTATGSSTTASNVALTIEGTVQVGGTNEQRFRAYRVLR